MNPAAFIHLLAGLVGIASAMPLMLRRVKMNRWYGVRFPTAFVSDARWYEVNEYGGKVIFAWSVAVVLMAIVGLCLPNAEWITYNWTALALIVAGLALSFFLIVRHCRRY